MQSYDIKRGHHKNIEGDRLKEIIKESFGEAREENGKLTTNFGALKKLDIWVENKKLFVETEMDRKVNEETAVKTIKAYNNFLYHATGFTAKERAKRLKKQAMKEEI